MDDRNPAGAGCARLYADRRRQGAEDQRSKTRIPRDPWARSRPPGGAMSSAALRPAVAAKNGAGQAGTGATGRLDAKACMSRAIVHWTAGAHRVSGLDRGDYHILIERDGKFMRGISSVDLNDTRCYTVISRAYLI